MNITVSQSDLKTALSPVERAVATGITPLTLLKHCLIDAAGDRIRLTGTDLQTAVVVTTDGTIEDPGRTTVDAKLLASLVGTLPDGPVTLHLSGRPDTIHITSGRNVAKLRTIPADDYPTIPGADAGTPLVTLPGSDLARMIGRVAVAAAKEDHRPVLNGVRVRVQSGVFSLAAVDGYRMAHETRQLDDETPDAVAIVPAPSMRELAQLVRDRNEPVTLTIAAGERAMVADLGDALWTARLIDGTFPDVEQMIPKAVTVEASLQRVPLLVAIRRALLFRDRAGDGGKWSVLKLSLDPDDADGGPGSIRLHSRDLDGGEADSVVEGSCSGQAMDVLFNGQFLADLFGAVDGERIELGGNGSTSAVVWRIPGDDAYVHIVMPVVKGN